MSCPLVAVVTPVYNGEAWLDETMQSVQAQTWPNTVHVLLDNASTDGTAAIIARHEGGRVPLMVFRNAETLPMMANWNKAFSHVPEAAAYVRLLCADDTITPDALAETVALAETDPEIGVVGSLHSYYGQTHDMLWPADRSVFGGQEAVRMILLKQGVLFAVQTLWRKSVADRRQPLFAPPLAGGMDVDTVIGLIAMSKFGFVHKSLAFTRVHEESETSRNFAPETRSLTRDAAYLLTRYGPDALGDDFRRYLLQYRRYFVRRIIESRRAGLDDRQFGLHRQALERAGWSWGPGLMLDAIIDWGLVRLGLRQTWTGFPGWQ